MEVEKKSKFLQCVFCATPPERQTLQSLPLHESHVTHPATEKLACSTPDARQPLDLKTCSNGSKGLTPGLKFVVVETDKFFQITWVCGQCLTKENQD